MIPSYLPRTILDTGLRDILTPNLKIIFCGINPGLRSAVVGHHFAGRGNRFWRVLHLAGFTQEQIIPENDRSILGYGYGLTTAVARATARADELTKNEFSIAAAAFALKIQNYAPQYVAFLGKPAYSAFFNRRDVSWGPQSVNFGCTSVWVLPNPSGLNRGFSLDDLVRHYRELRFAIDPSVYE